MQVPFFYALTRNSSRKGAEEEDFASAKAHLYSQFFTQRTQRRKERKVVVRGHSVLLSREDWGEGRGGGEGVVVRQIIVEQDES